MNLETICSQLLKNGNFKKISLDNILDEETKESLSQDAPRHIKNLESIKDFENVISRLLKATPVKRRQDVQKFVEDIINEKDKFEKDPEKSIVLRKKGNSLYVASKNLNDYIEVLRAYNGSIAYAPNKSEELALSYGNRATVLFRLNYFNDCLADINRALCSNYPDKSMGKLLVKKVRCMKIINHPDLQVIYNDCLKWVDKHAENDHQLRSDIKKAYEDAAPPYSASINMQFRDDLLEQMKKSCPSLDKLEIRKNDRNELTLVATRDIQTGEVIGVQKMYTQIFRMEKAYIGCWQCLVMCLNPVPCDRCTIAMYCSESCKAEAWNKHHENECQIMFVIQNFMSDFLLSIRVCMYAMKQLGGILPLMKEVLKMSKVKDMKSEHKIVDGTYPSESYRSIYFMDIKKPIPTNMKYYEIALRIGMFTYFIATQTELFNKQYQGEMFAVLEERVPKFFASLMLRHLIMLRHVQTVSIYLPNNIAMLSTPVCPLFYLIHLSCNPNSASIIIKDHQIVVAIDEIKKGQEINVSLCSQVLVGISIAERMKFKEKFFNVPCRCEVCEMKTPPEVVSLRVLVKNPETLLKLTIAMDEMAQILDKHDSSAPKTAAEFLQQKEELFKHLRSFFGLAPRFCEEVVFLKNYLLRSLHFQLQSIVYSFVDWNNF